MGNGLKLKTDSNHIKTQNTNRPKTNERTCFQSTTGLLLSRNAQAYSMLKLVRQVASLV